MKPLYYLIGTAVVGIVAFGLGRSSVPDAVDVAGSPTLPRGRSTTDAEGPAAIEGRPDAEAEVRVPAARTVLNLSGDASPIGAEGAEAGFAMPDPLTDTQAFLEEKLRQPTAFKPTGSMTVGKLLNKPPYNERRSRLTESDLRELEGILARHEDAIVAITAEAMRETDDAFDRSVQSRQFAVREGQPNVTVRSDQLVSEVKTRLGVEDQDFHCKYISVGGRAEILLYVTRRNEPKLFQLIDRGRQLNAARRLDVHRFFERLPR